LKAGDVLQRANGSLGRVLEVKATARVERVYNFTVDRAHTYFVGENKWLVHNADPCGVVWKSFEKGQLSTHYTKHGSEFGNISQSAYFNQAKEFGGGPLRSGAVEVVEGGFLIRYDPNTREVFVGHVGDRQVRTYYIADNRDPDPLAAAVALAQALSKK
jgi:hypothetical protein